MNSIISSRNIAEHLSTLAMLLEAESLRCKAYGAPHARDISRQAQEVRAMADQLWNADVTVMLRHRPEPTKVERREGDAPATGAAMPDQSGKPALDIRLAFQSLVL